MTAAGEEIFGLIEKMITDYQDEVILYKREEVQLKQMIDQLTILKPELSLIRVTAGLCHSGCIGSVSLEQVAMSPFAPVLGNCCCGDNQAS